MIDNKREEAFFVLVYLHSFLYNESIIKEEHDMVAKEHMKRLQQGAAIWNAWRPEHADETINLSGADFSGADLSGADLSGAYLNRADLSRTNLNGANLSGANLIDAKLIEADLIGTSLSGSNLNGAHFIRTDLNRANLSEANLNGAITYQTIFNDLNLSSVMGLETIRHFGPSGITTSTLERSEGNIPGLFLKGAGLSDTFIHYLRSLVQSPIQYYTCFISYSSKNQDFVERLYADLQQKGVRCWYAPEDLKIGQRFPERIEEAIRIYDKLVIILSEHSVSSSWVEDEVRAAQEKEERFKHEQHLIKEVLFPVKIDPAIDQASIQWAARLRRSRHIGNFLDWKQHDSYQKALQRLLRDLQQAPTKDEPSHDKAP
jgi:uncharacterized protein YjbI with pentapeptide repeats